MNEVNAVALTRSIDSLAEAINRQTNQLVDIERVLLDLKSEVGDLGSQVRDLDSTLAVSARAEPGKRGRRQ